MTKTSGCRRVPSIYLEQVRIHDPIKLLGVDGLCHFTVIQGIDNQ